MKGVRPGTAALPFDREAWEEKRDARRRLLETVRARCRMAMRQRRATRIPDDDG